MLFRHKYKKLFLQILVLFVIVLLAACNKKNNSSANPNNSNVLVDIYIYANTPEFFPLNTIGSWIYKAGGERGIVIYRNTQTDFVAFERSCPYDGAGNSKSIIKVLSDNITGKDSICGSKFYINTGSLLQGPSTYPLKAYRCTFDGNELHITNQ